MKMYKNKTTGERTCYNDAHQALATITKEKDYWLLKVTDGTVKQFADEIEAIDYVEAHYNF